LLLDHSYVILNSDEMAARKIELTKLFKLPARSKRSQNHDEQHSQSDSVVHSDAESFPQAPRTTASSGIVTAKPSLKVVGPNQKKRGSKVLDSGDDGSGSAEDDSREKEMAMSSPMKGSELRSTKVRYLCIAGIIFIPF
jgi:hypothetical protein